MMDSMTVLPGKVGKPVTKSREMCDRKETGACLTPVACFFCFLHRSCMLPHSREGSTPRSPCGGRRSRRCGSQQNMQQQKHSNDRWGGWGLSLGQVCLAAHWMVSSMSQVNEPTVQEEGRSSCGFYRWHFLNTGERGPRDFHFRTLAEKKCFNSIVQTTKTSKFDRYLTF